VIGWSAHQHLGEVAIAGSTGLEFAPPPLLPYQVATRLWLDARYDLADEGD
jgi:hypothetical protein